MYSTALLHSVFLVVLPTLALPQASNSVAGTSSEPAVASSLASITPSSASSINAASPDPVIAADFASLASELAAIETTLSKESQAFNALQSNKQTSENEALIATNQELAIKLAQAQQALADSKALALKNAQQALALKNAQQAQSDIATAKKACSLVQGQLDAWHGLGLSAATSPDKGSSLAGGSVNLINVSVPLFTKEEATLGCPGKATDVCSKFAAVVDEFNSSKQYIIGVVKRVDGIQDPGLGVGSKPQAIAEWAQRAKASAVQSAAGNIEDSLENLKGTLMC